jgi:mono/diheme cytochrome c family protein
MPALHGKRQVGALFLGLALGGLLTACGQTKPPSAQMTEGKALYGATCASCHGVEGEGQPNWRIPNEQGVLPAPPHDSSGHTWHHADEQILEMIAQGTAMPNSAMPAFGDRLNRAQMEAILSYIKTFWGDDERAFQVEVNRAWERRKE